MMSSSIFLLSCLSLLTFTSYFLCQHTTYSLRVMQTQKLSVSAPAHEYKCQENQVADKEMESTPANGNIYRYSPHDLVYHTDYHGLTTHPTPKHPKP